MKLICTAKSIFSLPLTISWLALDATVPHLDPILRNRARKTKIRCWSPMNKDECKPQDYRKPVWYPLQYQCGALWDSCPSEGAPFILLLYALVWLSRWKHFQGCSFWTKVLKAGSVQPLDLQVLQIVHSNQGLVKIICSLPHSWIQSIPITSMYLFTLFLASRFF